MGICWGSPDFPTPSFGRSFPDGPDLTLSSCTVSDTASLALASSHSTRTTSDGAAATPDVPTSPRCLKELRVFKFSELKAATGNFSRLLGETRFDGKDIVYYGWLDTDREDEEIAVKLIEFPRKPSRQQRMIVRAKVESYGCLSHANLARLLGYCLKGRKLLLVYESPRRYFSLEDHLYKSSSDMVDEQKGVLPPLPWHTRLQIAVEAAQGLAYLHLMDQTFLHYFQASYILLERFYAVKIVPINFLATKSSENVATGALSRRKQEVYDFGVVLLEILTGLALGRNRWSPEYRSRIEWIRKRVSERANLVTLMDSNMGSYPHDDAFQVAELAVHCLALHPLDRPSMLQVEAKLRQLKAAEISFIITSESTNIASSDQQEGDVRE